MISEAVQLAIVGLLVTVAGGVFRLLLVLLEVRRKVSCLHCSKGGEKDASSSGE